MARESGLQELLAKGLKLNCGVYLSADSIITSSFIHCCTILHTNIQCKSIWVPHPVSGTVG